MKTSQYIKTEFWVLPKILIRILRNSYSEYWDIQFFRICWNFLGTSSLHFRSHLIFRSGLQAWAIWPVRIPNCENMLKISRHTEIEFQIAPEIYTRLLCRSYSMYWDTQFWHAVENFQHIEIEFQISLGILIRSLSMSYSTWWDSEFQNFA